MHTMRDIHTLTNGTDIQYRFYPYNGHEANKEFDKINGLIKAKRKPYIPMLCLQNNKKKEI